jgi:hypothetical protein
MEQADEWKFVSVVEHIAAGDLVLCLKYESEEEEKTVLVVLPCSDYFGIASIAAHVPERSHAIRSLSNQFLLAWDWRQP